MRQRDEAMSCLMLMVCVAKADLRVDPEELQALEDALEDVALPPGVTALSLMREKFDPEALIAAIRSPEGRDAAYAACSTMAHADGRYRSEEHAIIERMEQAWNVSGARKGMMRRLLLEARDTVSFTSIEAIDDPDRRRREIDEDVMKYAILSGVLGLNPVPVAKLATEIAVVGVQGKVAYDVGMYWGYETTTERAKQLLAGMGAGTWGRVAVNSLLGFVPVVGSAVPAVSNFASTWAVGRVANQYFAEDCTLDAKTLRDAFKRHKVQGRAAYEQNKAAVDAKARSRGAEIQALGEDLGAGKITRSAYEERVLQLT